MTYSILGNSLNYLTTVIFQLGIAYKFGASANVSDFIFILAGASFIITIFTSTSQSEFLPILKEDNEFSRSTFYNMFRWMGYGTLCHVLWITIFLEFISKKNYIASDPWILLWLIGFGVLQYLCSQALLVSLVLGHKFLPYFAPSFPSLSAAICLFFVKDIMLAFAYLDIGFITELLLLLVIIGKIKINSTRVDSRASTRMRGYKFYTLAQYFVLSLASLIQKIVLSKNDSSSIAVFNYADRGASVQQQIVSGTVLTSSMATWARKNATRDGIALESLKNTFSTLLRILGTICIVSITFGINLIEIFYQHGNFRHSSSLAVLPVFYAMQFLNLFSTISGLWSNSFYARGKSTPVATFGILSGFLIIFFSLLIPVVRKPLAMSICVSLIACLTFLSRIFYSKYMADPRETKLWLQIGRNVCFFSLFMLILVYISENFTSVIVKVCSSLIGLLLVWRLSIVK